MLLFCCGVCQFICTVVSVAEMISSEQASRFSADLPNQPQFLKTYFLGDVELVKLQLVCHSLKYLGAIFLCLASFYFVKFCVRRHMFDRTVTAIWEPSARFFSLLLLGVMALIVRLCVLVLYSTNHVCEPTQEQSLEPNYILLGVAATFGLLGLFSWIAYVFAYIYNKSVSYEKYIETQRNKKKNIFTLQRAITV